MNRIINQVDVLGSGIMGSRIACHFANIGIQVLLLDIIPKDLTEDEKKSRLTSESPKVPGPPQPLHSGAEFCGNKDTICRTKVGHVVRAADYVTRAVVT